MMQSKTRVELFRNVLVLIALVGLVLVSWLLGHVLRFSIPAFWRPPVQEVDPQIEVGVNLKFEGIPRIVVLPGLAAENVPVPLQIGQEQDNLPAACTGTTYFTSLPAKCLTADGHLVQVRGFESNAILIPPGK